MAFTTRRTNRGHHLEYFARILHRVEHFHRPELRRRRKRADGRHGKRRARMTGVFGSLCSLLFIFFGSEVFSIFVPEEAAYRVGGNFLRIDGYSQLFMMLEITMQGVFLRTRTHRTAGYRQHPDATTCAFRQPCCWCKWVWEWMPSGGQ